jgi:hypothetical protein
MADAGAESMDGGTTFRREMVQREISRALVLKPLWQNKRCSGTAQDIFVLDRAFALIEAHPRLGNPNP